MKKLKSLSRLIAAGLVSISLFSTPVLAAETSTDSIIGINIDNVSISLGESAYFKFSRIDNENYDVVMQDKGVIGKVSLSFEDVDLYDKLISCEKSNFISSDAVYTDLSYDNSGDIAILKYKANDIRHIVFIDEDSSINFVGVGNSVLISNDNVQKIVKNVNISM